VRNNLIAPAGAINKEYLLAVVTESIRLANPKPGDSVSLWCPTLNMPLYNHLISLGFRVSEMDIFMADKQYVDWQRYVPAVLSIF
jgi:hypothetical protein